MKLRLVIEFDPEVQRWSAVFPELPGCASAGDTEEEAVANAKEALTLWFEPADVPMPQGAKAVSARLLADAKPTSQNAFKVKLAERTLAGILAQARG